MQPNSLLPEERIARRLELDERGEECKQRREKKE
jgi:hypothetical protein